MAAIYVQFSDSSESEIITWFPTPQDQEAWPNQGEVEASDPKWKTFFNSMPVEDQKFLPQPA